MKNLLFFALVLLPIFVFQSCSDSDNEGEEPPIVKPSIIGVWENNSYFVSFGSDGLYTAYIAEEFIDSGNFIQSEDEISCINSYFNRNTIYTIKNITDIELQVDINYKDLYGKSQKKNMTFTKSTTLPASKSNTLAGKTYTWRSSVFGNVRMTFSTNNSGLKAAESGSAAKYPLTFYYVYIGDRLYHQILRDPNTQVPTIGSWTTDYNTVKGWKLTINPNGSISGHDLIN